MGLNFQFAVKFSSAQITAEVSDLPMYSQNVPLDVVGPIKTSTLTTRYSITRLFFFWFNRIGSFVVKNLKI